MFHHFVSESIPPNPGAISGEQLQEIVDYLNWHSPVIDADELIGHADRADFGVNRSVLTFDDGLQSHYDVVLPILRELGTRAIFAVYTSTFTSQPSSLEIFASFRARAFSSFESFWGEFRQALAHGRGSFDPERDSLDIGSYLAEFPFYSRAEREFRFVRDILLTPEEYEALMWGMIEAVDYFDPVAVSKELWMNEDHLRELVADGHQIALHSHSHPTRIDLFSRGKQAMEYQVNFDILREITGVAPKCVAYPCGRFNDDTLEIMESLGVKVGFISHPGSGKSHLALGLPRKDHSLLLAEAIRNGRGKGFVG